MRPLPSGLVTFLFTDVEGSTRILERDSRRAGAALARHHELLRRAVEGHDGLVFETVGDAVYASFERPSSALATAFDAQASLDAEPWPEGAAIRCRMAVHSGEVEVRDGHYFGAALFRCARIQALAHGGQTLVSDATAGLVRADGGATGALTDLGEHRLKDLTAPERIWQLDDRVHPRTFPPLRSLEHRPHNLPIERDSFIGRESDIERIERSLTDGRLTTLVGTGGTGKTRLALHAAASALERYTDGVWFVDLSVTRDAPEVPSLIAATLGVDERPGASAADVLGDHLAHRTLLLVLDNLEQIPDVGRAIGALLERAPGLSVLATSRERLRTRGERVIPVDPLGIGGAEAGPAVRLFLERVMALGLAAPRLSTAVRICERIEGLPLAIELAAARCETHPPEVLLARLVHALPVLTRGMADVPDRQRTLRATIAWDHDLLDPIEQRGLRRASVFVGGFDRDAFAAVTGADEEVLDTLVARSLVRRPADQGPARYGMYEAIREFGGEMLGDEVSDARAAHLVWFASRSLAHPIGGDGGEALSAVLQDDGPNLEAALAHAIEIGDAGAAVVVGIGLSAVLGRAGRMQAGARMWGGILAVPGALDGPSIGEGLHQAALFNQFLGDGERALDLNQRALAMRRSSGAQGDVQRSLNNLGIVATTLGRLDLAQAYLEEATGLARASSDQNMEAALLINLAEVYRVRGHDAVAQEHLGRAVALARASAVSTTRLVALASLMGCLIDRDDTPSALPLLSEWMEVFEAIAEPAAFHDEVVGRLRLASGALDAANEWVERSLRIGREAEVAEAITHAAITLAEIRLLQGRLKDAETLVEEVDGIRRDRSVVVWASERARLERIRFSLGDRRSG